MGSKSAKLDIYWNLHKHCWSILDRAQGLVVLHLNNLIAEDVKLVVQPAGRARVLATGRKNVHAFIRASSIIISDYSVWDDQAVRLKYNPYKFSSFVLEERDSYRPIDKSKIVYMHSDGRCYAKE